MRSFRFMLAMLITITGIGLATPPQAAAYEWGAWSPGVYVPMKTSAECAMAKEAKARFIGPLQYPEIGCRHKIQYRKAKVIAGAPLPWIDQPIELRDTGGFSLFGMTMTAVVRYNGTHAVVSAKSCGHWNNLVTVKETLCATPGSWTSLVQLQIDYEVSFTTRGFGFARTRGARQSVSKTGWISAVTYLHG